MNASQIFIAIQIAVLAVITVLVFGYGRMEKKAGSLP